MNSPAAALRRTLLAANVTNPRALGWLLRGLTGCVIADLSVTRYDDGRHAGILWQIEPRVSGVSNSKHVAGEE